MDEWSPEGENVTLYIITAIVLKKDGTFEMYQKNVGEGYAIDETYGNGKMRFKFAGEELEGEGVYAEKNGKLIVTIESVIEDMVFNRD